MDVTIAGRYAIDVAIGMGGMGTVFRGRDVRTQQTVAIKELKPDITDSQTIERFRREGEALRALNHPNIVKMLDAVQHNERHYLILEYIAGGDLSTLLRQELLPIHRILKMGLDIADALTRAHRLEIWHGDLKPSNVLIRQDGTLLLTDFGVARQNLLEPVTESDGIVGTLDYLPPEIFFGQRFDSRGDIWAFGITLFEMITGKSPFRRTNIFETIDAVQHDDVPDLEALRAETPPALVDLIYRMLQRNPAARIQSVRSVGAELEDILFGRHSPDHSRQFAPHSVAMLSRRRHNLPAQTNAFVGRRHEVEAVSHLLMQPDVRLVTILGPGGMGKTRLSLAIAEQLLNHFFDGVYLVELAPLDDPADLVSAMAAATRYQFQNDGRDAKQQMLDYLAHKSLLLVMDNFEHLMDAAPLMTEMLQVAPSLKILVTSRQRLQQSGETVFLLRGMDFPQETDIAAAADFAAIQLFVQSARRIQSDFAFNQQNWRAIIQICQLVQGMPLGIMLAASWVGLLRPDEIASEIASGLDFLESGLSDLPARHQSLRAVFGYSWELLTAQERDTFMKLSIFRGGITREAAQAVAGADLRALMSLLNKSLVQRDSHSGRYEVHELLRQFGEEHFLESGLQAETRAAYVTYFGGFMLQLLEGIKGRTQSAALASLEADFQNILQAWRWAVLDQRLDVLDQMLEPLHFYCWLRNEVDTLEQALSSAAAMLSERRQTITWARLILRYILIQRDYESQWLPQAKDVLEAHDDATGLGYYYLVAAMRQRHQQQTAAALALYQQSIDQYQQLGDFFNVVWTTTNTGEMYRVRGDMQQAVATIESAADTARAHNNHFGLARALSNLAIFSMANGDYAAAEAASREAYEQYLRIQDAFGLSNTLSFTALIAFMRGDFAGARDWLQQALEISANLRQSNTHAFCLLMLATMLVVDEEDEESASASLEEARRLEPSDRWVQAHFEWAYATLACGTGQEEPARAHLVRLMAHGLQIDANQFMAWALPLAIILLVRDGQLSLASRVLQVASAAGVLGWVKRWSAYRIAYARLLDHPLQDVEAVTVPDLVRELLPRFNR